MEVSYKLIDDIATTRHIHGPLWGKEYTDFYYNTCIKKSDPEADWEDRTLLYKM